jgi:hypothetical protein
LFVGFDSLDVAELGQTIEKHATAAAYVEDVRPPTRRFPFPERLEDHLFSRTPPPMTVVEVAIPPSVFRIHEPLAGCPGAIRR